jgi:hypothetical protein
MRAFLVAALIGLAGCSTAPDLRPVAECPVCVVTGDLGCIRVRVDERTPTAVVDGTTYWFCSPRCQDRFKAAPSRYRR